MYYSNQQSFDGIRSNSVNDIEREAFVQKDHGNGLLGALKREATALYAYHLLLKKAHHENERNEILARIYEKQGRIQQLTDMYISITGMQPIYHHDQIAFQNFHDGLMQLHEFEMMTLEYYRYYYTRSQYPIIRDLYYRFLQGGNYGLMPHPRNGSQDPNSLIDHGSNPYIVNIKKMTEKNENFRLALWTGSYMQLTLMSIPVDGDIGVEVHPNLDQFLRIEEGEGVMKMGDTADKLDFEADVNRDDIIIIPAGKWHNLINRGSKELKLYSIYTPPEHPLGTVHETKEAAMLAEGGHDHH